MTKNIARYVRESTREQAINGYNLSDQKKKIMYYLKTYESDYKIYDYEDPGYSAKSLNRPGLNKLLNDVKNKKINCLIIHNLDRLTRRIKDLIYLLEYFQKYEVNLVSITEKLDTTSASGKFFTYLLCLIAQWEQDTISERTLRGLTESAEQGNYVLGGIAPFGFKKDKGRLIPIKKEIEIINDIFQLTVEEKSTEIVVSMLNAKYSDYSFTSPQIISIIKRRVYNGYYIFQNKKYFLKDKIISDELFCKANEIIKHRSRRRKFIYPFKSLVYTNKGDKMICICAKSKGNHFFYYAHKPSGIKISNITLKEYVLPRLALNISKKDVSTFVKSTKIDLAANKKKQLELINQGIVDSEALKRLSEEQAYMEKTLKSHKTENNLVFLNSISNRDLLSISKKFIDRIVIYKSKRIDVIFKSLK